MKVGSIPKESERDTSFFIRNYKSGRCVCGDFKPTDLSFCRDCFKSLPEELRDGLTGAMYDEDYQWTWNRSYSQLREKGRIRDAE
jgi:hypothetical protein